MRRPSHQEDEADQAAGAEAADPGVPGEPLNFEKARDLLMTILGKSDHPQAKAVLEAIRSEVLNLKPGA